MGKKKIEHIVFDGVRKQKPSIPFQKVNQSAPQPRRKEIPNGTAKKSKSQ